MEELDQREANTTKCQKEKCDDFFSGNFDDLLFSNHLALWNYANTSLAPFYIEKNRKSWLKTLFLLWPALPQTNTKMFLIAIHCHSHGERRIIITFIMTCKTEMKLHGKPLQIHSKHKYFKKYTSH